MITKVSDTLYRGPRPRSERDTKDLLNLGVTQVIDLESGVFDEFHDDFYEGAKEALFHVAELKCSDVTPPKSLQVKLFLLSVYNLRILDIAGITYVHCLHGKDRTGFMCAAYRIKVQKWSYWEAVREMFQMGFHWVYVWWLPSLYWRTK